MLRVHTTVYNCFHPHWKRLDSCTTHAWNLRHFCRVFSFQLFVGAKCRGKEEKLILFFNRAAKIESKQSNCCTVPNAILVELVTLGSKTENTNILHETVLVKQETWDRHLKQCETQTWKNNLTRRNTRTTGEAQRQTPRNPRHLFLNMVHCWHCILIVVQRFVTVMSVKGAR